MRFCFVFLKMKIKRNLINSPVIYFFSIAWYKNEAIVIKASV